MTLPLIDFQEFEPREELKPYVSRWVNLSFNRTEDYLHKIAPSGRIIMTHTHGQHVHAYTPSGKEIIYRNATYFKGHRLKEPLYVKQDKGVKEFACEFTYTGFYRLFHINADQLVDIEYEITHFGHGDLNETLFSHADVEKKLSAVEDYFMTLVPEAKVEDHGVEEIIKAIHHRQYDEFQLLHDLTVASKKKLYRKFKKQTGLSIKQFKRVHQMNTAVKLMENRDYESLAQLAQQAGYYDQADFIKHVQHYLRDKPTVILQNEHDMLFKYMGGPKKL